MRDHDAFSRTYRSALLEFVRGSGESGLANAYLLGRRRVDEGTSLLQFLRIHEEALTAILETTPHDEQMKHVNASHQFLREALSPFEMASRGYLALLKRR
jgi:hypothetical protein